MPAPPARRTTVSGQCLSGFALPVVIVILTVVTLLVVTQMRRSATEERLAANTRETVMLDNAAQTALRWCEWQVIERPRNTVLVAGTRAIPAWRSAANWSDTASLNFAGTNLVPSMSGDPTCIVEDATCELHPPVSPTGMDTSGCNGIDLRWRKFRITARVRQVALDLPGGVRETLAQSELRLFGE